MTLSMLAILLGLGLAAPQVVGLMNPAKFAQSVREFPRSKGWGYLLVALVTGWFIWNLKQESIADFAAYKPFMMIGFGAVGLLTCIYVSDFLAVRGLAVLLLLLAKLMVDTARWAESNWRLVIVIWAYGLIFAGMWWTLSPWRLRDILNWAVATEKRIRVGSAVRLGFALLVVILGLTVF
jgi:hypothetical protein